MKRYKFRAHAGPCAVEEIARRLNQHTGFEKVEAGTECVYGILLVPDWVTWPSRHLSIYFEQAIGHTYVPLKMEILGEWTDKQSSTR